MSFPRSGQMPLTRAADATPEMRCPQAEQWNLNVSERALLGIPESRAKSKRGQSGPNADAPSAL